jgi:hypothetical protein
VETFGNASERNFGFKFELNCLKTVLNSYEYHMTSKFVLAKKGNLLPPHCLGNGGGGGGGGGGELLLSPPWLWRPWTRGGVGGEN